MSQQLISRSPDLQRLRDEGYDIEVRSGHLIMKAVPYVDAKKTVRFGTLVCPLDVAGDVAQKPTNHQAYFAGDHPCHSDGTKIRAFEHGSNRQALAKDVVVGRLVGRRNKYSPIGRTIRGQSDNTSRLLGLRSPRTLSQWADKGNQPNREGVFG